MTNNHNMPPVGFHFQFFLFLGNPSINATVGVTHLHKSVQNNKTRVYLNAKSENGVQGDYKASYWSVYVSVSLV